MNKEFLFELPAALMAFVESLAYKKYHKEAGHPLQKMGFVNLQTNFESVCQLMPEIVKYRNPYCKVAVYDEKTIHNLALDIIENDEVRANLQNAFGMRFSVDYIHSSEISCIPISDIGKPFYANEFHRDMLFSRNLIKLFIALDDINENQGPTEWISKEDSNKIVKMLVPRSSMADHISSTYKFAVKKGTACLLNPHTNIHKAGVPSAGRFRSQLMVQLNPSMDWAVNKNLYERQFYVESNLPLLRNIGLRQKLSRHFPDAV